MSTNPVPLVIEAARRHPEDRGVQAMAEALVRAQRRLGAPDDPMQDALAGWRTGARGADGYGLMHSIEPNAFKRQFEEMGVIHEIAVLTEVLVVALNALGETIEY